MLGSDNTETLITAVKNFTVQASCGLDYKSLADAVDSVFLTVTMEQHIFV